MLSINKSFLLACAALVLSGELGLVWAGCGPRWVGASVGPLCAQPYPAPGRLRASVLGVAEPRRKRVPCCSLGSVRLHMCR